MLELIPAEPERCPACHRAWASCLCYPRIPGHRHV
jgi:hypothetical protein